MKAKLSMAFADLRGKDGSVVIQKGRSGLKLTPRNRARNPKSTAQVGVRSALSEASKLYANMTPAQVTAWTAFGASQVKHNSISGTTYTSTGINAFIALASKFLQVTPAGTVSMSPPTAVFTGDVITLTATAGTGQVTFNASSANTTGVTTELLLQPLKGKNRTPSAKGYRTKAFKVFIGAGLSQVVTAPTGASAAAYRFVSTSTGQESALVPLPVLTVALSIEDGGLTEVSATEAA